MYRMTPGELLDNGADCCEGEGFSDEAEAIRALMDAARQVADWADHHEPWNPDGSFEALRRALGRRGPGAE